MVVQAQVFGVAYVVVSGGSAMTAFAVADDDLLASDRLQLSGEVAGAAVRVDPRFVERGPEVVRSGPGDRRAGGRRLSVLSCRARRSLSACRGVWPVAGSECRGRCRCGIAPNTIRPRVPPSHGLPLPRPLRWDLPADWWVCGQNLAHDTRCAAVGNRPCPPRSRRSTLRRPRGRPRAGQPAGSTRSEKGATASSMRPSRAVIWALMRSMLSSIIRSITA